MKQQQAIPRQSAKVKRGTEFIVIATGMHVWFYILRPDQKYLVCLEKAMRNTDNYEVFGPEELKKPFQTGSSIKQVVRPVSPEERAQRESLDQFFDRMALTMPYNCMNCGKLLYSFTKKAKRSVTAHILPKATFKSIETDEANILFMGADYIGCPCNCHDRWDMNADIRVLMKIYPVALERFENNLKHKLTPGELKQAFTYLKIEWQ